MKRIIQLLRRQSVVAFLLFTSLFWSCMLYVFWPILGTSQTLPASDFPNLFPEASSVEFFSRILSGDTTYFTPLLPAGFLAYSLWTTEFFWMIPGFFAALSMFYYLRTQNLSRLAAYGGGLLFGFMGYWFTLFQAGHAGTTLNWGFIVLPFALLNRCFQTRKLIYFALLGMTLAWSMPQVDVWMIAMFLLATYGIWCSFKEWENTKSFQFLWQVYPRFLLTITVLLLVGFLTLHASFTSAKSMREDHFKEAAGNVKEADKAPGTEAKQKFAQWVFCTNWSLPPEDTLEFFVPGVFGDSSFRPPYPYWGRLGRDYQFEIGKMRPNLRQHTVYLGIVTLTLSLIGIMGWLAMRKQKSVALLDTETPCYQDVPFWGIASLLIVLFAMGRFTPFYNFPYYCLPFADYLRAPVKWLHLAEIGVAMLAGFGIQALLRTELETLKRKAWWVPAFLLGMLIIAWVVFMSNSEALTLYVSQLGFGNLAPTLIKYSLSNIARTLFIVFTLAGLLFWLSRTTKLTHVTQNTIIALIIIIGTVDLAIVARRYVQVVNVGPHHAMNPIVQALKNRTGGHPANMINYVTSGDEQQDWLSASLRLHGYPNMAPSPYDPAQHELFKRYQNEPLKYWEIKGVRFILLPRKEISSLLQRNIVTPINDFQIQNNGTIRSCPPQENSIVLAEIKAYAPLPALYSSWKGDIPADQQSGALQSYAIGLPVASLSSTTTRPTDSPPVPVALSAMRRQKGIYVTRGTIDKVAKPSLLVFNEPYLPNLTATVNGKEVPVGQANGQWAAIVVPAGASTIALSQHWRLLPLSIHAATCTAVLAWFFIYLRAGKRLNASASR